MPPATTTTIVVAPAPSAAVSGHAPAVSGAGDTRSATPASVQAAAAAAAGGGSPTAGATAAAEGEPSRSPAAERVLAELLRDRLPTPGKFNRAWPNVQRVADAIGLTDEQASGELAITPEQVRQFAIFYRGRVAVKDQLGFKAGTSEVVQWLHKAVDVLKADEAEKIPPGQVMLPRPHGDPTQFVETMADIGAPIKWHGDAVCSDEHAQKFVALKRSDAKLRKSCRATNAGLYLKLLEAKAGALVDSAVPPPGHFELPAPRGTQTAFLRLLKRLGVETQPHGVAYCKEEHVWKFMDLLKADTRAYALQGDGGSPPYIKLLHEKAKAVSDSAVPPPGHFELPAPQRPRNAFLELLKHLGVELQPHGVAYCNADHVEKFMALKRSYRLIEGRNNPAYIELLHEKAKAVADSAVPPPGHFELPAPFKSQTGFLELLKHLGVDPQPHGVAYCNAEHVRKFMDLPSELKRQYASRGSSSPAYIQFLRRKAAELRRGRVPAAGPEGESNNNTHVGLFEHGHDEMPVPTPAAAAAAAVDDDDASAASAATTDNAALGQQAGKRHRTEAADAEAPHRDMK